MALPLKSNVYSDVYITGNCIVAGTISSLAGSITSQWTTGGSSIYYNSGNVGIGLTNPTSILNVNVTGSAANVYNSTASASAGTFYVNTADNRRAFVGMDGTGLFALSTGALALGTDNTPVIIAPNYATGEKMRVTPGGNVGIGTTSPVSLLTVQGEARITGNLISAGFTSNSTNTVFNSDTLTVPFVSATQVLASTLGAAITGTNLQITSNVDLSTGTMNVATVISSTGLMFRNRIINGDFKIDQRNNGASFTVSAGGTKTYTLDRWWGWCQVGSKFSVQRSTDVPVGQGFTNSVLVTSLSAYSTPVGGYYGFGQYIEGYNIADMGFGTASATTATLSFWARSSIAGTFSVALENGSYNRSYIFNYTISSVNTWQYFTLPFRADTTGTWDSTTGQGLRIWWDLGSNDTTYASTAGSWLAADVLRTTGSVSLIGTNAATLYIAGAQVEKGSAATPFEFRPFATELQMCQRYYNQFGTVTTGGGGNTGNIPYTRLYNTGASTFTFYPVVYLSMSMRITPTGTIYYDISDGTITSAAVATSTSTSSAFFGVSLTTGQFVDIDGWQLSAEL